MKKNEKKTVLAKALTSVADGMLSKAANSRCALISTISLNSRKK